MWPAPHARSTLSRQPRIDVGKGCCLRVHTARSIALPESRYGSPLERDLQKALECELKRLVLSCTHRVSPSVAGFLASEPWNARRADVSWTYGPTAKSAILA